MPICSNCGNNVPDGSRFCTVCGAPIAAAPRSSVDPNAQDMGPAPQAPQPEYWQSGPNYAPSYSYSRPAVGSVFDIYGKAFGCLAKKPIRLWGLSLLYMVIVSMVSSLGAFVPIITLPITLILSLGFTGVLQDGYHGLDVRSEQLFQGFKKDEVVRNGAGMCWQSLWNMIWSLVPIMNIIKYYSYCFVPYILLTAKEITATEALRKSMRMTKGYKGTMFLADFLIIIGFFLVLLVLGLLTRIPYLGILFGIILVLLYIAAILFLPVFCGLVRTAFFNEVNAIYTE